MLCRQTMRETLASGPFFIRHASPCARFNDQSTREEAGPDGRQSSQSVRQHEAGSLSIAFCSPSLSLPPFSHTFPQRSLCFFFFFFILKFPTEIIPTQVNKLVALFVQLQRPSPVNFRRVRPVSSYVHRILFELMREHLLSVYRTNVCFLVFVFLRQQIVWTVSGSQIELDQVYPEPGIS